MKMASNNAGSIESILENHRIARIDTELILETTPRQAQYSHR